MDVFDLTLLHNSVTRAGTCLRLIIVGVVIVLLIIATSIFMIRRKRASSHKATYNIATVEQATRKPREAHI